MWNGDAVWWQQVRPTEDSGKKRHGQLLVDHCYVLAEPVQGDAGVDFAEEIQRSSGVTSGQSKLELTMRWKPTLPEQGLEEQGMKMLARGWDKRQEVKPAHLRQCLS